jgi:predicted nucleic acid-binding protein
MMFVLVSNVLSAIMDSRPVPEVVAWVAAQREELLFTVAVCQAEILGGIEILPDGRRRRAMDEAGRAFFLRTSHREFCRSTRRPPATRGVVRRPRASRPPDRNRRPDDRRGCPRERRERGHS